MQPADLRIDPFTWIPASARRRGALTLGMMLLAASCIAVGILIGRLTVSRSDVAEGPRPVTAVPDARKAAPTPQAASEPQQKPPQPSLALKGNPESGNQSAPEPVPKGESEQQPPPVVVLNPGTADSVSPRPRSQRQADDTRNKYQQRPVRRRADGSGGEGERLESTGRDYRALRDYMLSR
jgi:hypothetical protein